MNTDTKPSGIVCSEGCPLCAELKHHPSDLDSITEIAKSVGARTNTTFGGVKFTYPKTVIMSADQLLAFEQAILAKREEETICPNCHGEGSGEALSPYTQDTFVTAECSMCNGSGVLPASSEISDLREAFELVKKLHIKAVCEVVERRKEIDHLEAQLVMQAAKIKAIEEINDRGQMRCSTQLAELLTEALNTSAEDVAKYKAWIEKSVLLELRNKVSDKTADWGWCVEVMIDEMLEV